MNSHAINPSPELLGLLKRSIRAYIHGHLIYWDWDSKSWLYGDDDSSIDTIRPCPRCGKMPTPEGHDACLGTIEGATSACCGHGVCDSILVMEGETP